MDKADGAQTGRDPTEEDLLEEEGDRGRDPLGDMVERGTEFSADRADRGNDFPVEDFW